MSTSSLLVPSVARPHRGAFVRAASLLTLTWAPSAVAQNQPEPPEQPEIVVVHGELPATSASETEITGGELMARPRRRSGDLVEAAPGVISVQHSGGGKANQYFLRGFDIDHGTDLSLRVDGIQVNMPSHGHGQGYADLHFVIPETVQRLEVHKGPYYAQFGDFATAGALEMRIADQLPENQVAFTAGQYGVLRGLGIVSDRIGEKTGYLLAAEIYGQDGPFENPEDLGKMNLLGRVTHDLSAETTARFTWMSYSGKWNASGQIPLREVEAERMSRFGSIDPSEGGATQRHSAALGVTSQFEDLTLDAQVYAIRYDWRLYSNFTFFLDDPANGDQIEQTDNRSVLGTDLRAGLSHETSWAQFSTTFGLQARHDAIDNALYHDVSRDRLETRVDAEIGQTSMGFYVDEMVRFFPWLALRLGLRADRLHADVEDKLDDPTQPEDAAGGTAAQTLFSPKASLLLSPRTWLELFVNFGRGFHSNDARGATRTSAPADLLVPATGYEVGTKIRFPKPLEWTFALYRLDLDSEQVYVGDAGVTEPSDASTRYGLETTAHLRLGKFFSAEGALTLNRAVYRPNEGNGGAVALAPTRTITGALFARAPFGTFGSLQIRHIAERPATEDGSIVAEGWTVLGASLGHRMGPFELRGDLENVLNSEWREVQFATESRLQNEAAPVEEIHFAPGWPIAARATLSAYF